MGIKHLLLEVYCDCKIEKGHLQPSFCILGANRPGAHCFENVCEFLSYSNCMNEIAYVGEQGIVEKLDDFIAFGVEMEEICNGDIERKRCLKRWREICLKKIAEAYEEYMKI